MESPQKDDLKWSPQKKEKFSFISPPEAPVFYPTLEEFDDPLTYINKISKIGLGYGIIKIIPPDGWKPPFALNYDTFKFKPRIQKINELEAHTRIKLIFLSKVAKNLAKEGKSPKLPVVEKSILDLYTLNNLVEKEGGSEEVNRNKKWNEVATEMGFTSKTAGVTLKHHYETLIVPYLESKRKESAEDSASEAENIFKLTNIRELKSLEFLGPGPKTPICNYNFGGSMKTRTRHKKVQYEFDPLSKYVCKACGTDDSDGSMVSCKGCEDKYHSVCTNPRVKAQTKDWVCPKCVVASDTVNPFEEFGFETAEVEYSLKQFGQMADKFKMNHFKTPGRLVPCEKVEKEYWRIMGNIDSNVTVEYGADLSTMDVGSGFPTEDNLDIDGYDKDKVKEYARSKWNLNNLSVLNASALRHITSNISGMKVPWAYVGMCFSTFCWHNEDHWSYSINYLHWGEPKTWYGVSGLDADKFENEMKHLAPELFEAQPDLLHQLVTAMNPNLLTNKHVPIFRTDQKEGEFVVTFPRAYHAGFNQGFNFAEACNFAPADWISIGRESVIYYSLFQRNCVFSHDELICNIAEHPDDVDKEVGVAAYRDMKDMINTEMVRRKRITNQGITKTEKDDFSSAKDDNRTCHFCKTTCFLSAIYCPCSPALLVCLDHFNKLCSCNPSEKVLKFQYSIPELVAMHVKFIEVVDDFDTWLDLIKSMYNNKEAKPRTLCKLVKEAIKSQYPKTELLQKFKADVDLTLKCAGISRYVIHNIVKNNRQGQKLSLDDLNVLHKVFRSLPWSIPEVKSIESLINSVKNFHCHLSDLLQSKNPSKRVIESCLHVGNLLNVSFDEMPLLEKKFKEMVWDENDKIISTGNLNNNKDFEYIFSPPKSDQINEEVTKINDLLNSIKKWNEKAGKVMGNSRDKRDLKELEELFIEGNSLKVDSPVMDKLNTLILEAKKWIEMCQDMLIESNTVHLFEVEELLNSGKFLPVKLSMITDLENEFNKTKRWLDKVKEAFCHKNSSETLLETLWPRIFKPRDHYYGKRKTEEPLIKSSDPPDDFSEKVVSAAHEDEFKSLMALRLDNCREKSKTFKSQTGHCVCKEKFDGTQVTCELCQTQYHLKCFTSDDFFNKHFSALPYKNLYCSYCIRTKRPSLAQVEKLMATAEEMTLKVPEYHILKFYLSVFNKISAEIKSLLSARDVSIAIQKINSHVPKNYLDLLPVQLSDKRLLDIKSLVLQVDVLEVVLPDWVKLWTLLEATKVDSCNRKRLYSGSSKCNVKRPRISEDSPTKKKMLSSKKNQVSSSPSGNESSDSPHKKLESMLSDRNIPDSVKNLFTPDQLEEYLNEERCATENCVRPLEEEVNWVQCDGQCKLWFHMRCVNVEAQDMAAEDEYICLKCLVLGDPDDESSQELSTEDSLQPTSAL